MIYLLAKYINYLSSTTQTKNLALFRVNEMRESDKLWSEFLFKSQSIAE